MATAHIHAAPEDFAPTVLMPGDPLRAKFVAETYLEDAKLVNNVRGIQGYTGTYKTMEACVASARELGISCHVGNLLSSDVFYGDDETANARWAKMGILAVEMEGAALYMNAARLGKNALVICTVSDHILTGEALSPQERQTSFGEMITLALETARKLD